MEYILPLQKLIEEFCRLSGVGQKTATRYAFAVLDMTEEEMPFAEKMLSAAAMTYVASLVTSLVYFLRFLLWVFFLQVKLYTKS